MDAGKRFELISDQLRDIQHDMRARFDRISARFDAVDARFDAIDGRISSLHGRFDSVDSKIVGLHAELPEIVAHAVDAAQRKHRAK